MADLKEAIRRYYAALAEGDCCCGGSEASCCSPAEVQLDGKLPREVARNDSVTGLGCGFPLSYAGLRAGEVVLDLGSGTGVELLEAAKQVQPKGRAIGVDMTAEMVEAARARAARTGIANVEFVQGSIEALPVEASCVDVIISNCVINLVPDKRKAFREMFRVLKPGGRFVVSGALEKKRYLKLIREAGFERVVVRAQTDVGAFSGPDVTLQSITVEGTKPAQSGADT
jgi:arsenite methyltransferase